MGRSEHYIPRTKTELIRWLKHRYPMAMDDFKKMKKEQLYAIVYGTFRKYEGVTK